MRGLRPGATVLVRGVVGLGGVVLGPGIEIGEAALNIVGDLPAVEPLAHDEPCMMVLVFAGEADRMRCVDHIARDPEIEISDVRVFNVAGDGLDR